MVVRLSETDFKELRALTNKLQTLASEGSESRQLLDELDNVLEKIETDITYEELKAEGVTKTKGGAYIIS